MNRRTMLCAAPAVALAAAVPSTVSAATSEIWSRWQAARVVADEAHAIQQAAEEKHGMRAPEYKPIEEWAVGLWNHAFALSREGFRTPARNGADVIGKARLLAWDFDCDDWGEQEFGDLIERQLRDLAAAYGVEGEVAAILDPAIAQRDARRDDSEERSAQWEAEQQAKAATQAEGERRAVEWLKAAKAANMGVTVVYDGGKISVACDLLHMTGEHPGAIDDALAGALVKLAEDWRGLVKIKEIAGDLPVSTNFTRLITPLPPTG